MSKANAKDRLFAGIGTDDIEKQTCLTGYARPWRENDFVEGFELLHFECVIAVYCHLCSEGFDQMTQVVCERVVVVYDNDFHDSVCASCCVAINTATVVASC